MTADTPFYCINLDSRPDRWTEFAEEARRAGIRNVTRVPACDGASADLVQRYEAGEFPKGFHNVREVACWQSHIKAASAAAAGTSEFVVICEDDCVFVDGFSHLFDRAVKSTPKKVSLFYVGYLWYAFSKKVPNKGQKWIQIQPIYGLHCYMLRRKTLGEFVAFLEKCDQSVDDYITSKYAEAFKEGYVAAAQPLAYQRIESASDITGWDSVVNPCNKQIMNPLRLKYLWSSDRIRPAETNTKVLHVLPGQRLFFSVPDGWTVKTWTYHDELHDYKKYAKTVPFALWAVYEHGGVAFPDELSPWLDKYWRQNDVIIRSDVIVGKRGAKELKEAIQAKIWAFKTGFEGGRWGVELPESEVAPDLHTR